MDHCISKRLVDRYPGGTVFSLEDLSSIRRAVTKVRQKNRYISVSWPYHDLETKIAYKAKLKGSTVIKVDPRYTSQRCPECGYTDKGNRNKMIHLFCCKKCGFCINDDLAAARNILSLGKEWLSAQVPDDHTSE